MKYLVALGVIPLTLALSACGTTTPASTAAPSAAAATANASATAATRAPSSGAPTGAGLSGPVNEWAQSATATTNYGAKSGDPWNASQASGKPDVTACADDGKAWASLAQTTVDTLTLSYANALVPTSIQIAESYNPGWITTVTVSGGGQTATVYTATPAAVTGCPTILTIPISTVHFPVSTVAVTVSQTTLNSWAEIDAVGLTGTKASATP